MSTCLLQSSQAVILSRQRNEENELLFSRNSLIQIYQTRMNFTIWKHFNIISAHFTYTEHAIKKHYHVCDREDRNPKAIGCNLFFREIRVF